MSRLPFRASPTSDRTPRSARRGVTLVELLIVVVIMVMLLSVAIPLIQFGFQGKKVRESARQLNAFFAGAKARALERNRPVGVWFERMPGNPDQCMDIYYAEVPPPYSGDTSNASATVAQVVDTSRNQLLYVINFGTTSLSLTGTQNLVADNDIFWIKLNYLNPILLVKKDIPANNFVVQPVRWYQPPGNPAPPQVPIFGSTLTENQQITSFLLSHVGVSVPFQVYRRPRKLSVSPLALPNGSVVDLAYSGIGASGVDFGTAAAGSDPVVVMFSPSGRVDHVFTARGGLPIAPLGTLHFLLGKNDRNVALEGSNLSDMASLWVSVGAITGKTTTADNYGDPNGTNVDPTIGFARQFARSAQSMGGRGG